MINRYNGQYKTPSSPENEPPRWQRLEDMDPEPARLRRVGRIRVVVILVAVAILGLGLFWLSGFMERM